MSRSIYLGCGHQNKNSISVTNAMKQIFKCKRKPTKIQSDRGKEFLNKHIQDLLKSKEITFYTTNNETKCSIIERFNRTQKEKSTLHTKIHTIILMF